MSVYEICDTTDDEMYFPLGIFETQTEAIDAINKADEEMVKLSDGAEETETITIFQRGFGWTEHGTAIMTRRREEFYDEGTGEYYWRSVAT